LCTGAFTLAAAGLLDGRPATTHWRHAAELARRYPRVAVDPRVLYVDDGDILTSAGSAASIDLCLHVVRKDFGAEIANEVARGIVVPPHRDGGQAQYVSQPLPPEPRDDLLADTLAWMQVNLDGDLSVEVLARRAAMSLRTFARRFTASTGTTPHQWVLSQRVILAQRLLETTDLPMDLVAQRCGIGTAASLRQQFQRFVGTTPAAYRRTFRTSLPFPDDVVTVG
jgi:transcriptional regulator GlxA family with amidase domain